MGTESQTSDYSKLWNAPSAEEARKMRDSMPSGTGAALLLDTGEPMPAARTNTLAYLRGMEDEQVSHLKWAAYLRRQEVPGEWLSESLRVVRQGGTITAMLLSDAGGNVSVDWLVGWLHLFSEWHLYGLPDGTLVMRGAKR